MVPDLFGRDKIEMAAGKQGSKMSDIGGNSREQLKSIIERVESVNSDIKERQTDRSEIFQEAKSAGFDTKALRQIIRIRAEDPNKRAEREAVLDTYMSALGMT